MTRGGRLFESANGESAAGDLPVQAGPSLPASAAWPVSDGAGAARRDLAGAVVYAAGLGVAALLIYAFNVVAARRLGVHDFGTFGALSSGLLVLSGPVMALLGGAAMVAARRGRVPLPRWLGATAWAALGAALVALLPLPEGARAFAWFGVAVAMSIVVSWNRGLLVGLGRLGWVGASLALEAASRVGFLLVLVRGHGGHGGVAGAAAGMALGIALAAAATAAVLPRAGRAGHANRVAALRPDADVASGVVRATVGLLFLGALQFADVIAIRVMNPRQAGSYAAAATLARLALFAQAPAAAFALRRASVGGARRALPWSLGLGVVPGAATLVVLEVAARPMVLLSYGHRYASAAALVRVLAPGMVLAGVTLVLVHLLMGGGRTAWVGPACGLGIVGVSTLFATGGEAMHLAVAVVAVQAVALATVSLLVRPAVRPVAVATGRRGVVFMNWRDTAHPQGGGSEVFVEQVARRLALRGFDVTIFCAEHAGAPAQEIREGVRFLRRGSWWSVYLWGAVYHALGRFGPHDVVVDVQNGVPFFARLYCDRRTVVLVHHVHREQWGLQFGPGLARLGWLVESRLAPLAHRGAPYVVVSEPTRADLAALRVDGRRIAVVRNGSAEPGALADVARAALPTIAYLGRLVPSKRVELLLEAAAQLRSSVPGLRVVLMGKGLWEDELRRRVAELSLEDVVRFEGFVDESAKFRVLSEAWVLALPSIKEGWGLAVMEAAACGTPAVAFRVGGLRESVLDGETGLLCDDLEGFIAALRRMLADESLRAALGAAARARRAMFSWDDTAAEFCRALELEPAAAGASGTAPDQTVGRTAPEEVAEEVGAEVRVEPVAQGVPGP